MNGKITVTVKKAYVFFNAVVSVAHGFQQPLPSVTRLIRYCLEDLQATAGDCVQTDWSGEKLKPQATFGTEANTSTVLCHDDVVCLCAEQRLAGSGCLKMKVPAFHTPCFVFIDLA